MYVLLQNLLALGWCLISVYVCCESAALNMPANLENSPVATGLEKKSVFIPIPKKRNAKESANYHTIALISHASKVMLKVLQARLQQYVNHELPDVQAGFRKGRGTRYQIANICWIMEKAREFQKNIYFCFIDYAKAFDCVDHKKTVENSERDGNTRPPDLPLKKPIFRSGSNSENWMWNNRLVRNWKRSTSRLYTVTLLI